MNKADWGAITLFLFPENPEPVYICWNPVYICGIQKLLSEEVQLRKLFLLVREDPNTTISAPSSVRQRNAILLAFRWRADYDSTLNMAW